MKIVILFLAAALGSANPVRTQNLTQAQDGQKSCDCSKPFRVFVREIHRCPAGYENVSDTFIPKCIQIGCSAEDYEAQCDAKP
ncbi:hypothetical protein BM221_005477 [Beauveria bassiana]|uniref:Uncharacterized protein n=1 Tax=Beauveria bassiana TaxID=176275 RepID=A0A2N6NNP2_BEABA|nr:hypothetical protein BM221_005477 [Beauveria bassiana]